MLALIQLCATADAAANVANAVSLVRRAASQKAKFICLPEAFDYIVDPQKVPAPQPEPVPGGRRTRTFCELAKELNVWISLGGMHELPTSSSLGSKLYNTHVIINSDGELCATYRKIHLFDAMVDNGYKESNTTLPGNEVVVVHNTPIGTVGLTTCYDVRFPVLFQRLRDEGCDVILVPAAFAMATGEAGHWHSLLRARAIENQVYIAAAAQCGANNSTRTSYGHSLLVDPFGLVKIDLLREENAIGWGEISSERIAAVRAQMPVQLHRFDAKY